MLSPLTASCNLAAITLAFGLILPAGGATFQELNSAFGIPVWADDNLWVDEATAVAARLHLPEESTTAADSSYRAYPGPKDLVLGARAYSVALYGDQGRVSHLSLMFANKGDAVDVGLVAGDNKTVRDFKKQERSYKAAIQRDAATISSALSALLGPPSAGQLAQGGQMRESVQRWEWKGHAILLAAPRGEYLALRILPVDAANSQGKAKITDTELRQRLLARVDKRPNGDVILRDIPMVDQGPKGYCVPATWERVMRYMGIPADMYILAMAGGTGAGGGTDIAAIVDGARDAVIRGGRRLESEAGKVSVRTAEKYINRGIPIMWAMFSMDSLNNELNARMSQRVSMTDPLAWKKSLDPIRKAAKKIPVDDKQGHMCMIIGYNELTGEIAVSDSWGPRFAERWMTEEEALAVSQGQLMAINF